jgi:hypothetical protein
LEHYKDKSFTGGFFRQWDGNLLCKHEHGYSRGCCDLDYTPKTLDSVVAEFQKWCDSGYKFPTRAITVDDKTIRHYPNVEGWKSQ